MSDPILVDTKCPGCKKEFSTALEKQELALSLGHVHQDKHDDKALNDILGKLHQMDDDIKELKNPKQEAPKEEKPAKKEMAIPDYMPFVHCKSGDCDQPGSLHRNPGYRKTKRRKCDNCESMNGEGAKGCDTCGRLFTDEDAYSDLDDEDLTRLGIPIAEPEKKEVPGHVH